MIFPPKHFSEHLSVPGTVATDLNTTKSRPHEVCMPKAKRGISLKLVIRLWVMG